MALCKRVVQSGAHLVKLRLLDATHKSPSLSAAGGKFEYRRHMSELAKPSGPNRTFLVDTLALVRRLESQEVSSKQAEAIIAVLIESLDNLSQSCASKEAMQKSELIQESSLSNFKVIQESSLSKFQAIQESSLSKFQAEVQSSQVARDMIQESNLSKFQNEVQSNLSKFQSEVQSSLDHHFSMLQRESEKQKADIEKVNEKLQGDIDKKCSELRYEIDKATAGQRLDLNLERGRTRDELANQKAETNNLTNKLDREIQAVRAQVEAAKYDIIKYCIGTLVSISAVGLAVLRILL